MTNKRTIAGKQYIFRRNKEGFAVTGNDKQTDRFYRSYQVYVTNGQPMKCTCPDCHYRANWCKHLKEVEKILEEERRVKQ